MQDDDVGIVERSELKAVCAHIGRVAHIALRTEHHLDALGSGGIVLDKQNSHGGDLAPEWFPRFIINQFAEAMLRNRSEEHTSELQSLMRISYAVFCLNNKISIQAL